VAGFPTDAPVLERLWVQQVTAIQAEFEARHGVHLAVRDVVDRDIEFVVSHPHQQTILLAVDGDRVVGTGWVHAIGPRTAEIKRMFVEPDVRGRGFGKAILEALVEVALQEAYWEIRLDTPDFAYAAHALYRSNGFVDVEPDPDSDAPTILRPFTLFMARRLI